MKHLISLLSSLAMAASGAIGFAGSQNIQTNVRGCQQFNMWSEINTSNFSYVSYSSTNDANYENLDARISADWAWKMADNQPLDTQRHHLDDSFSGTGWGSAATVQMFYREQYCGLAGASVSVNLQYYWSTDSNNFQIRYELHMRTWSSGSRANMYGQV